jgi:SAM-dependent methyltransferase
MSPPPLLELARRRAAREGITNLELRHGDATSTGLPDRSFDAVVCVFGVFFAADMTAFVSEMWRLVRPGGVLALTTWGPNWADPLSGIFWQCVRELEPSLHKAFNPWDDNTTPAALGRLFASAGILNAETQALAGNSGSRIQTTRGTSCWGRVCGERSRPWRSRSERRRVTA